MKLKNIFRMKPEEESTLIIAEATSSKSSSVTEGQTSLSFGTTYKTQGLVVAGQNNGALAALEPALTSALYSIKDHQKKDEVMQEKYKAKLQEEIEKLQASIEKEQADNKTDAEKIDIYKQKIEKENERIEYVKKHPEEFGARPETKALFWIGAIILILLFLYLSLFYSSASYSAFFKEFHFEGEGVVKAIFDAKALGAAWDTGVTAFLFVLLIPFVFLGLGVLMHFFQAKDTTKSKLMVIGLVATTFVFDVILEYEITEKLYELKAGASFREMPEYNLSMAFQSINFWSIIFAGFIVYLIWGFLFGEVMKSFNEIKLDKARLEKEGCKNKIEDLKKEIVQIEDRVTLRNTQINKLQKEKADKEAERNNFIYDKVSIANELTNFFEGWLLFVVNHTTELEAQHTAFFASFRKEYEI